MKRHIATSLLFATLAFSQSLFAQNNPAAGSQPQTTPAPSSTASGDPLPPATKTDFWDGDDPNLFNLVTHPFASKKYVQRMTRPIKDRLNELDQITTSNSAAIKDVDARTQHGLQLASEKTSLADQHATDAANRAQLAQTAATDASTHVATVEQKVGNLDQYKPSTQTEIRFRPGQTLLSKTAKEALDQMAAPLKDQRSYVIEVRGYAPGRGSAAIANSQKMADSVVRYLVLTHNIPVYRIYMVGMGNPPAEEGAAKHAGARVEVSLLKNEMTAQR
jgi:outer membrane protein OmpA-like peptidoglycan-associated protein